MPTLYLLILLSPTMAHATKSTFFVKNVKSLKDIYYSCRCSSVSGTIVLYSHFVSGRFLDHNTSIQPIRSYLFSRRAMTSIWHACVSWRSIFVWRAVIVALLLKFYINLKTDRPDRLFTNLLYSQLLHTNMMMPSPSYHSMIIGWMSFWSKFRCQLILGNAQISETVHWWFVRACVPFRNLTKLFSLIFTSRSRTLLTILIEEWDPP